MRAIFIGEEADENGKLI